MAEGLPADVGRLLQVSKGQVRSSRVLIAQAHRSIQACDYLARRGIVRMGESERVLREAEASMGGPFSR
jgi:hypothetical protein